MKAADVKPRFYHYAGAHLPAIVAQASGVALVSVVSVACAGLFAGPVDALSWLEMIVAVAAAYGLGALLGTMLLGPLLFRVVSKLAGAPFSVGDQAIVLRGRRKGKVAEIYEVWECRGQARLRLSDDERETVADVFAYYEILKTKPANAAVDRMAGQPAAAPPER